MILRKLKLSEKFQIKVLYVRNSALGVSLLVLRTIVNVLALKLYFVIQRARSKVVKMLQINEDNPRISYAYAKSIMETNSKWKPKQIIWSNEIQKKLERRKLQPK